MTLWSLSCCWRRMPEITHHTFNSSVPYQNFWDPLLSGRHYPLQTWGALFPASSVAFEEPGGRALFCGTAEPAVRIENSSVRYFTRMDALFPSKLFLTCSWCHHHRSRRSWWSPAHCSSSWWSSHTPPGGAQADSDHSCGDLWHHRQAQRGACWFRPRFSSVGLKFLTPTCFDYISIFKLLESGSIFSPCCSTVSLCRGLSLLKETTDSVSVCSSRVSTLPVAFGL